MITEIYNPIYTILRELSQQYGLNFKHISGIIFIIVGAFISLFGDSYPIVSFTFFLLLPYRTCVKFCQKDLTKALPANTVVATYLLGSIPFQESVNNLNEMFLEHVSTAPALIFITIVIVSLVVSVIFVRLLCLPYIIIFLYIAYFVAMPIFYESKFISVLGVDNIWVSHFLFVGSLVLLYFLIRMIYKICIAIFFGFFGPLLVAYGVELIFNFTNSGFTQVLVCCREGRFSDIPKGVVVIYLIVGSIITGRQLRK